MNKRHWILVKYISDLRIASRILSLYMVPIQSLKVSFFSLIITTLFAFDTHGQVLFNMSTWSSFGNDYINTTAVDSKGNTYVSFNLATYYQDETIYHIQNKSYTKYELGNLVKLDKDGNVVWMKNFDPIVIKAIAIGHDDNLYIAATSATYSLMVAKISSNGDIIWSVTEGTSGGFGYLDIILDANENVYVAGETFSWTFFGLTLNKNSCCEPHDFLVKFDNGGKKAWAIASAPNNNTAAKILSLDSNGNIVLAGEFMYSMSLGGYSFSNNIGYTNVYVARISPADGTVIWARSFGGTTGNVTFNDLKTDTDGSIFFSGAFTGSIDFDGRNFQSKGDSDFFLGKMSSEGVIQWLRHDGTEGLDRGDVIQIYGDDLYSTGIFSGDIKLDNAQIGSIPGISGFVSRFQKKDGVASWIKSYGSHVNDGGEIDPYYIHQVSPGLLKVFGSFNGHIISYDTTVISRSRDIFCAELLDTTISQPGASLRGKIFYSENASCNVDQVGLNSVIIKAEPGPLFAISDGSGHYELKLPAGNYDVSQILPDKIGLSISQVCVSGTQQVEVTSLSDTLQSLDFGDKVIKKPYMVVDLASGRFRRCFTSTLVVQYSNEGQADASNVLVAVNFPGHVKPIMSTPMWSSKTDSQLIYNIGSVRAGAREKIVILDSITCGDESIRGLTECITATLTPSNDLDNDSNWDHSDITVSAHCLNNGFVRIVLKNTGTGSMADSANFVIYANDVLAFRHKYKLASGDSLVHQVPANGKTIRIEAFNTPNSLVTSVSATVEACASSIYRKQISKGFVNAFPQAGARPETETFCGTIRDSFDPNEKLVVPAGITSQNYISGNDELEFVINFQNTGNAEARNITVRDRLNESLDLSTLQISVASHPFMLRVEMADKPELVWRFRNIQLPDSSSDESKSHGFVKFKIRPLKNLPSGTIIRNSAAIYFDFNSPVYTNETINTIGLPDNISPNAIEVQDCSQNAIVDAGSDKELMLCDDPSITIEDAPGNQGSPYWILLKGSASVDLTSDKMNIQNIEEGSSTIEYIVTYCDKTDSSTIVVDRTITPEKPALTSSQFFCLNDAERATVSVTGENVSWYSDAAFKNKVSQGNDFFSKTSVTLFVTDEKNGCESVATRVDVSVVEKPLPPKTLSIEGCANMAMKLSAEGNDLLWYTNPPGSVAVYAGKQYATQFTVPGDYLLYVSQSENGCESEKSEIVITVKQYDRQNVFIANVITPNDDDINDYFYLTPNDFDVCLGNFKNISIYNRYGHSVFTSGKSDFKWNASDVPSGVYFYAITFEKDAFHGSITVIK